MTGVWAIVGLAAAFVLIEALIVMVVARLLKAGRSGYGFALLATLAWSVCMTLAAQFDGLPWAWVHAAVLFLGAVFFGLILKTSLLKGLALSALVTLSVVALIGAHGILT